MITVCCDTCREPLTEQGALAFSPPDAAAAVVVRKFHICRDCWHDTVRPIIVNGDQA